MTCGNLPSNTDEHTPVEGYLMGDREITPEHDAYDEVTQPPAHDDLSDYASYTDERYSTEHLIICDRTDPTAWIRSDTYDDLADML